MSDTNEAEREMTPDELEENGYPRDYHSLSALQKQKFELQRTGGVTETYDQLRDGNQADFTSGTNVGSDGDEDVVGGRDHAYYDQLREDLARQVSEHNDEVTAHNETKEKLRIVNESLDASNNKIQELQAKIDSQKPDLTGLQETAAPDLKEQKAEAVVEPKPTAADKLKIERAERQGKAVSK